ncbi:hypothetical protein [Streptomyces sp. NPDC101206]|uniref:ATP-dependent DNA ligase n=1 Tax=Streptomyces sp. NPDC101206 TaxID=3366128 RepID=UPI0037F4BCD0
MVLDGELVVWHEDRLALDELRTRAAATSPSAVRLATAFPAHFIAFDILQKDNRELLGMTAG